MVTLNFGIDMTVFFLLFSFLCPVLSMEQVPQAETLVEKHFRPSFLKNLVTTSGYSGTIKHCNTYITQCITPACMLEQFIKNDPKNAILRNGEVINTVVLGLKEMSGTVKVLNEAKEALRFQKDYLSKSSANTSQIFPPLFNVMNQESMDDSMEEFQHQVKLSFYILYNGIECCKEIAQNNGGLCRIAYSSSYGVQNETELQLINKMIWDKQTITPTLIETEYLKTKITTDNPMEYVNKKNNVDFSFQQPIAEAQELD